MKQRTLSLIFLSTVLYINLQAQTIKSTKSSVDIFKLKLPSMDKNGMFYENFSPKILIKRKEYENQFIQFPTGGTLTDVYIKFPIDSSFNDHINSIKHNLLWNITNLPDGKYHADYGSCNYAGSFEIELITDER